MEFCQGQEVSIKDSSFISVCACEKKHGFVSVVVILSVYLTQMRWNLIYRSQTSEIESFENSIQAARLANNSKENAIKTKYNNEQFTAEN
mgnify:CR=1 FL=1